MKFMKKNQMENLRHAGKQILYGDLFGGSKIGIIIMQYFFKKLLENILLKQIILYIALSAATKLKIANG